MSLCLVLGAVSLAQAQAQSQGGDKQPEETFTLSTNDMDIIKLVQLVAEKTGKTIVIDPSVKGKVRIMTNNNAMTKEELYETFRSVLEVSNFTVVEVGNVTRIIPLKEARTSPISDARPQSGPSEIVTDVIPVQNISANKLLQVLRPLVSTSGYINPHDSSNSIVVTDSKANIDRIRRLVKRLDQAAISTTEVVYLKYAEAESLVATLDKLDSGDKKNDMSQKLQIVADKRNNAILLVGEDMQRERIKNLIERLDRPQQLSGNVRVVYLDYADAKKVAEVLSKVVQNLAKVGPAADAKGSPAAGATVEADEDTNALLITAEGDTLNSLLQVVEKLDIRRAQVLVEAIIVQVDLTDNKELGLEWLFSDGKQGTFGGSSQGANASSLPGIGSGLIGPNASLLSLGTGIASIPGQTLGVAGLTGDLKFLAILHALEGNSHANVLSTPSLMTLDNHEANISVGQQVPFKTGSYASTGTNGNTSSAVGNPFTTIQREDIGITLKVTPQINEGNKVMLEIDQEVSSLAAPVPGSSDLVTNQSKINTNILANDGEIVVLGGLIKNDITDGTQQVPVLGSIPILGQLFKYQSSKALRSNLMVFLRAKVIRDDENLNAATSEKYDKMRGLQIDQRKKGLPLLKDSLMPVMPEISVDDLELSEKEKQAVKKALQDEGMQAPPNAASTGSTTSPASDSGDGSK